MIALLLALQAEELQALAERMKDAKTMTCRVRQVRKTALVERPLVSSGTMAYRREPGRLVFRLTEPRTSEIHMDRRTYQVYRPDEKRLERIEFEDDALTGQLLTLFEPKPDVLGKSFKISRAGDDLLLEPLDEKVRPRVASLALTVKDGELRRLRYTQADGDEVTLEMSDVRLNPDLPAASFELRVREGTRILTHKIPR